MTTMDLLFLGTHGHVTALDKRTGREVWRTSLPNTGYRIVSMLVEDGTLFAASRGHVFALDPVNGSILWSNSLPSLGHDHVYMTTARSGAGTEGVTPLARASLDDVQRSSG